MKLRKFIMALALSLSGGPTQAVTFQLQGNLSLWSSPSTSTQLNDLVGTSFSALLTYDENALPTSVWLPYFTNYADQGNIVVSTLAGAAAGKLSNLQTFIYSNEGTNFNGYAGSQGLNQQLTVDLYNVTSIDFAFASLTPAAGLSSFDLPVAISLEDFNNGTFVRLYMSNGIDTNALIGTINQVSLVPPSSVPVTPSFILMLTGIGFLGLTKHSRKASIR